MLQPGTVFQRLAMGQFATKARDIGKMPTVLAIQGPPSQDHLAPGHEPGDQKDKQEQPGRSRIAEESDETVNALIDI
jgi:hypothetical protein